MSKVLLNAIIQAKTRADLENNPDIKDAIALNKPVTIDEDAEILFPGNLEFNNLLFKAYYLSQKNKYVFASLKNQLVGQYGKQRNQCEKIVRDNFFYYGNRIGLLQNIANTLDNELKRLKNRCNFLENSKQLANEHKALSEILPSLSKLSNTLTIEAQKVNFEKQRSGIVESSISLEYEAAFTTNHPPRLVHHTQNNDPLLNHLKACIDTMSEKLKDFPEEKSIFSKLKTKIADFFKWFYRSDPENFSTFFHIKRSRAELCKEWNGVYQAVTHINCAKR